MESLTDDMLAIVLGCLNRVVDRNNAGLVCRRFYDAERVLRTEICVGCEMNSPRSAIAALSTRFINLSKVKIAYPRWISSMGNQVDDSALKILSQNCHQLSDLSLVFCCFITDVGMGNLTLCKRLQSVRLNFLPCVTGRGLLSLVSGCRDLTLFHIESLVSVRTVEWLDFLGRKGNIQSFAVKKCRCVGDLELRRLGHRGWHNLQEFSFEVDLIHGIEGNTYGYNGRQAVLLNSWSMEDSQVDDGPQERFPYLQTLSLTKSLSQLGTGLYSLMFQSSSLRHLRLDTCIGLSDEDLLMIAHNCSQLSSLYLRAPMGHLHLHPMNPLLSDVGLLAVAQLCSNLETLELSVWEFDPSPVFSSAGIAAMVENCSNLRRLILTSAIQLSAQVISAVFRSITLKSLELVRCRLLCFEDLEIVNNSVLDELIIRDCDDPDACFDTLRRCRRLRCLTVDNCPNVDREGLVALADVVYYNGTRIH